LGIAFQSFEMTQDRADELIVEKASMLIQKSLQDHYTVHVMDAQLETYKNALESILKADTGSLRMEKIRQILNSLLQEETVLREFAKSENFKQAYNAIDNVFQPDSTPGK
jgi:hypothetical protein